MGFFSVMSVTRREAETQEGPVWTSGNSFYSEGDQALVQVAQRGCGVCPWRDSKTTFWISSDIFSQTSPAQQIKPQGECTGRGRHKRHSPEWLVLHDPFLSRGVGPDHLLKSLPASGIQWFLALIKSNNTEIRKVYCILKQTASVLFWNY